MEAFAKLDESGDGMVTLEDVKGNYDASNHPKVVSGEMSEDDVLTKFLGRFEGSTKQDGEVGGCGGNRYIGNLSSSPLLTFFLRRVLGNS